MASFENDRQLPVGDEQDDPLWHRIDETIADLLDGSQNPDPKARAHSALWLRQAIRGLARRGQADPLPVDAHGGGSPQMAGLCGVWVFRAAGRPFTGGVFTTRERAENWIRSNRLTGMLTLYPVDIPVYDWAVEHGVFVLPRRRHESTPQFIGGFTDAAMEHYHYEDGIG
jgi:hypothetical protein